LVGFAPLPLQERDIYDKILLQIWCQSQSETLPALCGGEELQTLGYSLSFLYKTTAENLVRILLTISQTVQDLPSYEVVLWYIVYTVEQKHIYP